ncbi:MAG TPA: alanine racemase [Candidatus Limnocylindrales bacterium]|nr:alanine racemase [Candidatus Limnocylindrales bacterium]
MTASVRRPATGAQAGIRTWHDLDTPVALVDLARLEANLTSMAAMARNAGVAHRPHAKTHKTREVAERQLAHGASGLTVAKIGEAEAFVDAGFDDLFIAYPVVGERKLARLLSLLDRARIRFEVDTLVGAEQAAAFLDRAGRRVEVVVSVDGGAGRSGAASAEDAIAIAERVAELPALDLVGVMNYGNAYGTTDPVEQAAIGRREGEYALEVAAGFRSRGLAADVVTVGSTPTAPHVLTVPGITELRAGVYAFLDLKQVTLNAGTLDDCALTILATVVSHARPDRYVLDAGLKALAGEDYGWGTWGRPLDRPDLAIVRATEEHGIVELPPGASDPGWRIGESVRIVPNHACGAVNMHDELVAVDGERVVERWPVIARGRFR